MLLFLVVNRTPSPRLWRCCFLRGTFLSIRPQARKSCTHGWCLCGSWSGATTSSARGPRGRCATWTSRAGPSWSTPATGPFRASPAAVHSPHRLCLCLFVGEPSFSLFLEGIVDKRWGFPHYKDGVHRLRAACRTVVVAGSSRVEGRPRVERIASVVRTRTSVRIRRTGVRSVCQLCFGASGQRHIR